MIKSSFLAVFGLLFAFLSSHGQSGRWEIVSAAPAGQSLVAVASPAPSVFVAVGGSGRILRSENAGESWTEVPSSLPVDYQSSLTDLSFGTSSTGTAVGRFGIIVRTLDGGRSWTSQQPGTRLSLSRVFFLDENFGMITGAAIFKTRNGGADWESMPFDQEGAIGNFRMLDTLRGFAVGPGGITGAGTIFKTEDGGKSWDWVLVEGLAFRQLNDIAFVGNTYGLIVGTEGTVLRTEDGGRTWSLVPSNINDDLNSVAMMDAMNAVAVGTNGAIIRTTDGGKNWQRESSPTDSILYAVALDADGGGVIVGGEQDGIVLRYTSVPSGVDEADASLGAFRFDVAPNPASDRALIEWGARQEEGKGVIVVRNLLGEQIEEFDLRAGEGSLIWDVGNLPSGVYFVTLTIGKKRETRRVICR